MGPDDGAKYLVTAWGGKTMRKRRAAYVDGKVGYRPLETLECEFDVKDKNILLIDDMIRRIFLDRKSTPLNSTH